jgi:Predicted dehydrogenases and related proteins
MMRIGMIGLGIISRFYAAAFNDAFDVTLVSVCDTNPSRMAPYRDRGVAAFTDYRVLLESPDVDSVVINVPNDQHFTLVRDALMAGKHVCCEKPLTTRLADALELAALAERSERTLFTAFHRRYNRNLRLRLPELLDCSNIVAVSADYLERIEEHAGPDSWYLDPKRCGGGCIADNGPNVFDALCSFLGPLAVVGSRIVRDGEIDVQASVRLLSGNGVPVQVSLDWQYDCGEKKQLTVLFKDGRMICVDFLAGFAEFKGSLWHEYEGVLEDFVRHATDRRSDGGAGCEAVRMVDAAYAAGGLV